MNERIRKLRRILDLTQQEFADRLGIKRNTIANYESGRNEPIDAVISLICREFDVDEEWLRTGGGEMFIQKTEDEEIAELVYDLLDPKDDDFYIAVIELLHTYKDLTPTSQKVIREFASSFIGNCKKRKGD